eukprot:GHVL01039786.1.p1 GENE.GHVL01039786.1~~GHVL01039786.1.p1  ORF type:complete len:926 (+),score=219.93 GHVL01039786.1:39-2816(+)
MTKSTLSDKVEIVTRRWCKLTYNRPWLIIFGSMFVPLILTIIALSITGVTPLLKDSTYVGDWLVPNSHESEDEEAYRYALASIDPPKNMNKLERIFPSIHQLIGFTYTNKDPNDNTSVFTPEKIVQICELESVIFNHPRYNEFCVLDHSKNQCAPVMSSLAVYFYRFADTLYGIDIANKWLKNCELLPQNVIQIGSEFLHMSYVQDTDPIFFLGSDYIYNNFKTNRSRSMIRLGTPLTGYVHEHDREEIQLDDYDEFWRDIDDLIVAHFNLSHTLLKSAYRDVPNWATKDLQVEMISSRNMFFELERLLYSDTLWAVVAAFLVWAWIALTTRSTFIATFMITGILLCFLCTWFWFRIVLNIKYWGSFQKAVIFILFGVGADSLFVTVDAWRDFHELQDNERLYQTYKRTVTAVFNTSFTTAVALFATAASPIMPLQAYGIYGGIAILMDYAMAITLGPAILIAWHKQVKYWERFQKAPKLNIYTDEKEIKRENIVINNEVNYGSSPNSSVVPPLSSRLWQPGDEAIRDMMSSNASWNDESPEIIHENDEKNEKIHEKNEKIHENDEKNEKIHENDEKIHENNEKIYVNNKHIDVNNKHIYENNESITKSEDNTPSFPKISNISINTTQVTNIEKNNEIYAKREELSCDIQNLIIVKLYLPLMSSKININNKKVHLCALISFILFIIITILSILSASKLEISAEQLPQQFFPKDHLLHDSHIYYEKAYLDVKRIFLVPMHFMFGIKTIDRSSNFDPWLPKGPRGNLVFDNQFEFADPRARRRYKKFCEEVAQLPCPIEECRANPGFLVLNNSVHCFINDFEDAWEKKYRFHIDQLDTTTSEGYEAFQKFAVDYRNEHIELSDQIGIIDNRIAFVSVGFNSTIEFGLNHFGRKYTYDMVETFIADFKENSPNTLKDVLYVRFYIKNG